MRHRRASNALEFALTLPIYLILFSGIADFGWYFDQRISVTMAARDAARAGALVPVVGGGDPVVVGDERGNAALGTAGVEGVVSCTLEGARPDIRIRCTAAAPFGGLVGITPLPGELLGTVTMRMAEQP